MTNRALKINPELKEAIIACLLGEKPMFNSEIIAETGCTKWQVACVRKELNDLGHRVKIKKVPPRKTQFVLAGRTEAEADAAREKEKANASSLAKEAKRRHRKLLNLSYKREIKSLYDDPLMII